MCGIAGIIDLKRRPVERALVERMCRAQRHRGPDDQGVYVNCHAALGQSRLSIIDLSRGRQPMSNETGTVWVTFNGEIYNFRELRRDLEALGHRFATDSDTEVIVHAYEQYGERCLEHFRGMFAFAVWDAPRQTLFLARDRVGKKPLFYAEAGGSFLFASELQALVEHPAVSRAIDPAAIDDYLTWGYVPAPRTIFQGVFKLPPAHSLSLSPSGGPDGRRLQIARYWELPYAPKLSLSEPDALAALEEVLTEAVRLRMIADVPLGALLSGGVDSSVVVALMSRLSSGPVRTFSIGFDEREFNELPYARLVARHCGTEHHELVVRPTALEILPTLVRHYGEPFADSSAVPSYYVAQLTRQHVKVALNGDGGDESFAGYDRYWGSLLADRYQRLPALLRRRLIEPLSRLVPDSLSRRNRLRQAKRFLEAAALPAGERYVRWVSLFPAAERRALYSGAFRAEVAGRAAEAWLVGQLSRRVGCAHQIGELPGSTASTGGHSPPCGDAADLADLDRLLAVDVQSYLPYDLLVKMDIAAMAHSLETRSPLLDHKVMEFAARLPAGFKLRGRTAKYLLKQLGARLLPPRNLSRRKMGFGVPVGQWLRGELRPLLDDLLLSERVIARGYFRSDELRRLVDEHTAGRQDHSYRLWALLWLELWHREFIDG